MHGALTGFGVVDSFLHDSVVEGLGEESVSAV